MIFAVVDYIKYRFMLGRYSKVSMTKEGFSLCNKQNIQKYLNNSKPMDIFFLHTRVSVISWLVMYYTDSFISHCSMLVKNNEVLEATTQGVVKTPITDYIDDNSYYKVMRVPNLTEDKIEEALIYSEALIGIGYNWERVIKLFLKNIFGSDSRWKVKFSLDLYILFIILYFLKALSIKPFLIIISIYSLILLKNRLVVRFRSH